MLLTKLQPESISLSFPEVCETLSIPHTSGNFASCIALLCMMEDGSLEGCDLMASRTRSKGETISRVIASTLCMGVIFGITLCAYLVFIPWESFVPWASNPWISSIARLFLPIVVAPVVCCAIANRTAFRFRSENLVSKFSILKVISRVVSVFFTLAIGYVIEKITQVFGSFYLTRWGDYGDMIGILLGDFIFYIGVSLFMFIFAVVEYFFVVKEIK
jgi:hypothetical protein